MIKFPIFKSLTLTNYELYPSSCDEPFKINFQAGPNLIVGVNGSGKTTLIGILFRSLSGPFDLPSATSETELGQIRARAVPLTKRERQVFGARVADGAGRAQATLSVDFGPRAISLTRRLSDLALVDLAVDGESVELPEPTGREANEKAYQRAICDLFGVGDFFDVLIILRFLIFMMEDRRALVWDPSAQRQIFRVLMLPPARAKEYAVAQQAVISADSNLRNTNQMIKRLKDRASQAERQADQAEAAEAQRTIKIAEADAIRDKLENATAERIEADEERKALRLARLKALESRDSLLRELERIKIEALRHWLSPTQETALYVLGHLLADGRCLVCNTKPSPAAAELNDRVRQGLCPVCGSKHADQEAVVSVSEVDKARIVRLEEELQLATQQITEAEQQMEKSQARFEASESEYIDLEMRRIAVDRELVEILRKIPTERAAVGSVNDEIGSYQAVATEDRNRLKEAEKRFEAVVSEALQSVQKLQDDIANAFSEYLQLFLKESATLVYQTVSAKVGQGGDGARFTFPAFRLAMTGGATAGETIRDEPGDVSLSQAEFVDLAFRMALLSIAADDHSSSLVVDAPEASLDFLFAHRAGDQLAAFSWATPTNRVIITSYLPSKHLVTSFLERIPEPQTRKSRIVDLIHLAADNAALRADRPKYEQFLNEVIENLGDLND
ncbi:hypothetical protein [Mesorhizobium sp. Z1-4]|uniref:hypothetical protein n=1 Tax=Mesorhizobium sp. Z1-4 TaxID=2448478 RepID=UPI000FDB2C5F|nr:hypothetical protein [Mesorhizobium sp. Z1-4]